MANHDKPTEKQLNFIDIIKSYVKDDFHGSTKAEDALPKVAAEMGVNYMV